MIILIDYRSTQQEYTQQVFVAGNDWEVVVIIRQEIVTLLEEKITAPSLVTLEINVINFF